MSQQTLTSPTFKQRSDIHWARKLWHMGMVGGMFLCWTMLPEKFSFTLLAVGCIAFIPLDFARQRYQPLNDWVTHVFSAIMRNQELTQLAGTTYLLGGVLFVALVFPHQIVSMVLLFLAFADPIASYFGIRYGRDKIFMHKSLQGTLAAYVVCVLAAFGYIIATNKPIDRGIVFSLAAGAVGALAELVPVGQLDDNLTLPIFSAMGLTVLYYFFGFWSI